MPHAIWKGVISFGLVQVPVTLYPVEIQSFTRATEIPFTLLEKPYYLEPGARGEKVYSLLREAMLEAGVIGIARVVLHTKEYLAALIPTGPALMLNTLRWASEIRPWKDLNHPAEGRKSLKESELKVARQLIGDMTEPRQPDRYEDKFIHAVHELVAQRVKAGQTKEVEPMEEAAEPASNVIDLSELLKKSLQQRKPSARSGTAAKAAAKAPARKAPARKRA